MVIGDNMNNTILYVIVSLISVILLVIFVQYLYVLVTRWKNRKIKQNIGESTRIRLIHQLREAIEYLADNKIGAIITIENNDNLDMLRTDGVIIDANISSSLIISIFNKSFSITRWSNYYSWFKNTLRFNLL